ncbi:hypothetical protein [Paenibacillus koleovorans]|uniref:hypothetical protein n=1 Tax=Paenibacillus koleovorans TaxID=121608 RepID=UPI000FDAD5AF|nr:hypothetical protein [Paenibacillus koleovorans]
MERSQNGNSRQPESARGENEEAHPEKRTSEAGAELLQESAHFEEMSEEWKALYEAIRLKAESIG